MHGFTGTPKSMRPWGEHLAAAGFTVRCPLLPGHGTRWQDCNASTHDQMVRRRSSEAFDELRRRVRPRSSSPGLSMGGTLATRLAEVRPDDVAGLVLVNPSLLTQRLDAKLLPLLARLTGAGRRSAATSRSPASPSSPTPKLPTRAMMQLRSSGRPPAPTSPGSPRRCSSSAAPRTTSSSRSTRQVLLDGVASTDVTEVVLEDSYHVATLDNDAPAIFAGSVDWIRAHVPAQPPAEPLTRRPT